MHAVRLGLRRGWMEFVQSIRSTQDQWFYLFTALAHARLPVDPPRRDTRSTAPTWCSRRSRCRASSADSSPSASSIGPAYALAMEKEDGTLLRHQGRPRTGWSATSAARCSCRASSLLPQLVVILVPSFLLFDGLMADPSGWFTVLWVIVLGLLAALPIGMVIGALVPGVQKVGMWGMLPIMVLAGISGIFYPIQQLWGWVQVVAQMFPMYWMGLGMRSAFLPDAAAAPEIGGSWRTVETVLVLGAWAVAGALADPDRAAPDGAPPDRLAGRRPPARPTLQWVK